MWSLSFHSTLESIYSQFVQPYLRTYSIDQNPSREANWFSASQEIPYILWNPKVRYRIYKCPHTLWFK
jgi:hypothetical protein